MQEVLIPKTFMPEWTWVNSHEGAVGVGCGGVGLCTSPGKAPPPSRQAPGARWPGSQAWLCPASYCPVGEQVNSSVPQAQPWNPRDDGTSLTGCEDWVFPHMTSVEVCLVCPTRPMLALRFIFFFSCPEIYQINVKQILVSRGYLRKRGLRC